MSDTLSRLARRLLAVLAVLCGAALGTVVGAWLGKQYYVHLGPPWGQYGYEFEGLWESLVGAALGAVVGAALSAVLVVRRRRAATSPAPRSRREVPGSLPSGR